MVISERFHGFACNSCMKQLHFLCNSCINIATVESYFIYKNNGIAKEIHLNYGIWNVKSVKSAILDTTHLNEQKYLCQTLL